MDELRHMQLRCPQALRALHLIREADGPLLWEIVMEELTQFQVMIDAILWALEEGRTKIGSPVVWSQEGIGLIMVTNMMHMPQPMIVAGIKPTNPAIYELLVQWLKVQPYIVRIHRTSNSLLAQFSN